MINKRGGPVSLFIVLSGFFSHKYVFFKNFVPFFLADFYFFVHYVHRGCVWFRLCLAEERIFNSQLCVRVSGRVVNS